jgi:soluble lytic murein transglycosylase-like protein
MKIGTCRVHALAVLHVLILLLVPNPSGSVSSTPSIDPIDAREIALLETLSEWVDEDGDAEALRAHIRNRSTSFEVFRSFHDPETRSEYLDVPYRDLIRETAERYALDPFLLAAITEVESQFRARVVSHRGAVGLMQVLPSTAAAPAEYLTDPKANLDAGARYLEHLLERFDGDLELALAAYNAGPTNVRRYGGMPPFRETRRYVEKVLELYVEHHRQVWVASDTHELLDIG